MEKAKNYNSFNNILDRTEYEYLRDSIASVIIDEISRNFITELINKINFPVEQVDEIDAHTVGFKVEDGVIVGLGLYNRRITSEILENIGNLTALRELGLYLNKLTTLPDSFAKLENLEILFLGSNQLQILPNCMEHLRSLIKLYITHIRLQILPDFIGNFINLEILDLNNNKLTELPESIGNCVNLVELYVFMNQLEYIPTNLPLGNYGMGSSYDVLNDKFVMHSGYSTGSTYLFDPVKNQLITVTSGISILHSQMIYDPINFNHILFGGAYTSVRSNETKKFSIFDTEVITPTIGETSVIYETSTVTETSTETINMTNVFTSNITNTITETSTFATGTATVTTTQTQTDTEVV